ncbi:MAG: peptide deformylase [Candidatus Moranbacteria bacterium]|nr:peptide deformylase [Candidatus Moranbacteria bacterium]
MIIKNLIQVGNPLLKQKSKIVKNINSKETQKIIKNLIDSLNYHELVGLASSQIGEKSRIFVTKIDKTPNRNPDEIDKLRIYINPKIIWSSKKEIIIYEGCGSVAYAKFFAPVKRPEKIIIEATDEKGDKFNLKVEGLLSRVIQHEYDHLEGIEFTEKITDMKKIMSSGEYRKMIFAKS